MSPLGLGRPFTVLMHFPDKELVHVPGRKEYISTSQCVQKRIVIFPLNPAPPPLQPIFVNGITILLCNPGSKSPCYHCFSLPPMPYPQPICCQFFLPVISYVCPLLYSHCCCPNLGAYCLLPGLQQ